MRVCYLVNQYPKVSHSFVRREILELERQGVEIVRISVRGWTLGLIDRQDEAEREKTFYILRAGLFAMLTAAMRTLGFAKGRAWTALVLAAKQGWHSDRPLPIFAAYLLEAMVVADLVRQKGITHIHAHFGTNSTDVAMLASELSGIPYSFTVHGPDEFDRPISLGLGEKIARARFVVAISQFGRGQLLRWCDYTQWPKIHVVHCGVDASFLVDEQDTPGDPKRLVCVGRLCREKGQVLLVQAAARLRRAGEDFSIVLAGDGEMRAEVEDVIAREGLADHVTLTGWVDGARVRQEIVAARALVLPSLMEGLPVVIMEALALRRPVVTTYVAGIPELVRNEREGWLIPAGSVEDLTEALRACLHAPAEQISDYGESGRQRAVANHSVSVEATKLASLFSA